MFDSRTNLADELLLSGLGTTFSAACHYISQKHGVPEAVVKYELIGALFSGEHLVAGNQSCLTRCLPLSDAAIERLSSIDDPYDGYTPEDCGNPMQPKCSRASSTNPPASMVDVRIGKILSYLEGNGIDIMKVPSGWKAKTKKYFTDDLKLCSPAGFDAAWKEASRSKQLRVEKHHMYTRRN